MSHSSSHLDQLMQKSRTSESKYATRLLSTTPPKQRSEHRSQENLYSNTTEEESDIDIDEVETFVVGEYNFSVCPICLEHFTMHNPAIIVHCEHGFHLQCLESWRQRSAACPVCQRPLDGDEGRLMEARDTRRRRRFRGVFPSNGLEILGLNKKLYESADMGDSVENSATCKEADVYSTFLPCTRTTEEGGHLRQEVSGIRLWRWLSNWCSRI
ncbi:unnamed protein product [Phytomonas sp. Hart1]|nr:unnamed protein product [Phytomonas sp. Hart1]|eukprot:CCW70823.1 unnamed protein product [Phytomonas sp. isolate Hart1]